MSAYFTDIFHDIHMYDVSPARTRKDAVLILSLDPEFKKKAIEENCRTVLIGFKENSLEEIVNFAGYFEFFMKVLPELKKIVIDGNAYSPAFSMIHSAALNLDNIREIGLYVDSEDIAFSSKDTNFPFTVSEKERTYSRREFLDGGSA